MWTLRQKILFYFAISYGAFLLLQFVISISIFAGTSKALEDGVSESLSSQAISNVERVLEGSRLLFIAQMETALSSIVSLTSNMINNSNIQNYSIAPLQSFLDWDISYLPLPILRDARQPSELNVSLTSSNVMITDATPSGYWQSDFSSNINATIDVSSQADTIWPESYASHSSFVQLYAGFATNPKSLHRRYPATATMPIDPLRLYDPTLRSWYQGAINANGPFVTPPYLDFFDRGWMITLSTPIGGGLEGVAGADMLISTLQTNINEVRFLEDGKLTLFEQDGTVVSDREWAADANDSATLSWSDLENPTISEETWDGIKSGEPSQESDDHFIISQSLESRDALSRYRFAAFIPKDVILTPVQAITDEMRKTAGIMAASLLGLLILLAALLWLQIHLTAKKIVQPLKQINDNIGRALNNIGRKELSDGFETISEGLGEEQLALQQNFNHMITTLQQERETETLPLSNPYHGGSHDLVAGVTLPSELPPPALNAPMDVYSYSSAPPPDRTEANANNNETVGIF